MNDVKSAQCPRVPATANQQGLCLLHRLRPASKAFLLARELVLTGFDSPAAVVQAVRSIQRDQPSLRCRFVLEEGQFWMEPSTPEASVSIEVRELADCPPDAIHSQGEIVARELAGNSFDPEAGPLVRFVILCHGEIPSLLVAVWHHVISDEESWNLFCDALQREAMGVPSAGEERGYQEHALELARRVENGGQSADSAYWRGRFGTLPASVSLLGVRRPRGSDSEGGGSCDKALPEALVAKVTAFRERTGVSTFRILLSAAFALLHRLTGEQDLTIGTTLRNRSLPGADRAIGYFNNQAALRLAVESGDTFLGLVTKVDKELSLAVRHEIHPFSMVLQETGMARSANPWPFTFTKLPAPTQRLATRHISLGTSAHPLAIYCASGHGQIRLSVEHQDACCEASTVDRLLAQYIQMLDTLVSQPESPIDEHCLITPGEEGFLPDPREPLASPHYPRVLESFDFWVSREPGAVAIRQGGRAFLFGQLAGGIQQGAGVLSTHGVRPGEVVAVSGEVSPGLIAAIMSVWSAGAVLLMVDSKLPEGRVQLMLREARVTHWIRVGESQHGPANHALPDIPVIRLSRDLPGEEIPVPRVLPSSPTDDPAYVFFTSGTTGTPKAVLGSHRGLAHFLAWQRSTFEVRAGDRVAQLTGLSFDVILRELFLPLTSGATLCLPDAGADLAPDHVLPWLQAEGITLLHTVPSLARLWVTHPPAHTALTSLRCVFFAGEPLSDVLVSDFRRVLQVRARIINLYGPTETTLAKCFNEVPDPPEEGVQPVGRPQPQTQALILSPKRRCCAVGEPGEIVIRTPFRSHGYLNAAEESARRFVPNPFSTDPNDLLYLTGDRGMFLGDGRVAILGRLDFQVKIRGVRIEPGEVETVLSALPDIAAAAVVALKVDAEAYRLAGYYVPKPSVNPDIQTVRSLLRQRLPESHVPESLTILERLPLTPNGKLDRRSLPPPNWNHSTASAGRPPSSATEILIAAIWRRLLNVPNLDAETSFFDLGGHSLLALRMLADIRRETRYDLTLPELFQEPTVAALALRVDQANSRCCIDPSLQSVVPIRANGSGPAVFLIPGGNGGDRELFVHVALGQNHFDPGIRSFGLRARGHKSGTLPHRSLRELATDYISEMRAVSDGPYHIIGDCTGGNVAFEIACQLQDMGLEVGLLALCDCSRPRSFEYGRYWIQSRYQKFRRSLVGRLVANLAKIPWIVTRNGRQFWANRFREITRRISPPAEGPATQSISRVPEPEYWTPLGERYRRTVTTHSPRKFEGSIVHFLSQTHEGNSRMLAWAEHITGKQHIHVLQGDHWHYLWENGPVVNQVVSAAVKVHHPAGAAPLATVAPRPGRSA